MTNRIEDVRTVHEGWLSLRMARLRLDDGSIAEREVVDHPSGAAVLPYHARRRAGLFISELRPPVEYAGEPRMIEAIAGKLDESDAEACARREAQEEAGVRLGALERVAELWMTPASSTERVTFFLAEYGDGDRVSGGGGLEEEHEAVRVREVPLADVWRRVEQGELRDAKALILLQALRLRRPELFGQA
jgi:nudix-type nucleoside diphosphatase (YffH/AdpP family)